MDVPVYHLDLYENSCSHDKNKCTKNAKSLLYRDSGDSVLFSQESQPNTSNTSFDKNESFWQSLRNLWRKKNSDKEVNLMNGIGVQCKVSQLMANLNDVENNVSEINLKVDEIESLMMQHSNVKLKPIKEVLKTVQNLNKKSEKTNCQCAGILNQMQSLNNDLINKMDSFKAIIECNDFCLDSSNSVDELSNNLSSEILMKFQSILQNILSDISAEILMQWNDVLYNIYLGASNKSKKIKKNKCKIVDFRKSPGNYLINTLRRSERIQNKIESESLSFNKDEIMFIRGKRIENHANKCNQKKFSTRDYIENFDNISHKSIPLKRSFEIFKYYEENRGDSKQKKKFKNTGMRTKTQMLTKNENHNTSLNHDGGTSNYDSEADLVSLRKLFDC